MSYCSAQDPRIFFGLGKGTRARGRPGNSRVGRAAMWTCLHNLAADYFVTWVEEGSTEAKAVRGMRSGNPEVGR